MLFNNVMDWSGTLKPPFVLVVFNLAISMHLWKLQKLEYQQGSET